MLRFACKIVFSGIETRSLDLDAEFLEEVQEIYDQ